LKNKEIFVIGAWPDTKEKLKILFNKINFLKEKNFPICLVTHYPVPLEVQELVDYYIYEKENILSDDWKLTFWRIIDNDIHQEMDSKVKYHGIACLMNIRNAIDLLTAKEKYQTIHYVEYDLEYDFDRYMKIFNNNNNDDKLAVFVHYQDEKYRTDLFSCDMKWYNSIIPRCQTWNEYERVAPHTNYILEYWFSDIVNNNINSENIIFIKDFNVINKWTQADLDWDIDERPILDFTDAPEVFHNGLLRHNSFKKVLEELYENKKKNPLIVEIGVTRHPGNLSDGDSTSIWAWYISKYGGSYYGCDINKDNLLKSEKILKSRITDNDKSELIALVHKDGIEFLKTFKYNSIDLLYLDTIDWIQGSNESGIFHLKLLLEAIDKVSIGGYIMFDDVFNVNTFTGKAEFAIPYLLRTHSGFMNIYKAYQFIFRKDY